MANSLRFFCYDFLGGRKILPPTKSISLTNTIEGRPLKTKFKDGFEYSNCWVEDSRLVILNARDTQNRGATIFPRVKFIASERTNNYWKLTFQNQNTMQEYQQNARYLINVASPWVGDVLQKQLGQNAFYANIVPRQKKF